MNEFQAWLEQQHHGLWTFKSFQHMLEQFGDTEPKQRGLCRVLTCLVQDYIETFEESPVPVDVADNVHRRLAHLLSTLDLNGAPERRLEDINRVANFTLWPAPLDRCVADGSSH
ncbi:hypothetical protein [Rhodopseudomonas telluris]|uniref:Uncharacterized protein n=1 Tax=Rhodopseudomonas telluris TaxID=644215 RepID=A0ABV6EXR7_9BRAD